MIVKDRRSANQNPFVRNSHSIVLYRSIYMALYLRSAQSAGYRIKNTLTQTPFLIIHTDTFK